jgi:raffinose/stachyose/melibiose transport system substrate-binding protein
MKKRRILVVAFVALMVMAATVLASSSKTSGTVVWWGWTPGSPMNEQYIAQFNKVYPNIKVIWKQTSIADYDAAIRPALASGQGVDAFEVSAGSGNGGVDVYGGQAIDLTNAVKKALGDNYKDKLGMASIATMTVNGQLKALGVGSVYAGNLWINQDLFNKYNVKVPTNLDEWIKACKVFKEHGIIGFVQGAGQGAFNMDTFHAIADNVSPGTFTKAARGEVKWTDGSLVKALELWKGLFSNGIMQPGALGLQQYPEANNLFMAQKAAMVMMGSWYTSNCLPDTMKAAINAASSTKQPFTMVPIDFPDIAGTGKTGSMFGDLDYATAVSASSKNIMAATTFAVWLGTSQEGQQMIANSLNVIPSLKSATQDWSKIKLVNPKKQNDAIKNYTKKAMNSGDNPRFADINADMNQTMIDVLAGVAAGTITPKDGAAQLEATQADSK